MKSFLKYLLVLLSGFFILFLILFIFLMALTEAEPTIDDNSYLHLTLSGTIPEYVAPSPLSGITGSDVLDLKSIRENLEKAAVDERIRGVVLDIGIISTGYAKINELLSLIHEYRQSGKKIYAYMDIALTREYMVAIACDSVFMTSAGNLFLTGVSSEATFYEKFFNTIGIKADFVHTGKYKSAPDRYTSDQMSDNETLVLNNILDQYYEFIIKNISENRSISIDKVRDLINNQTGFTGKEALEIGLVDGLKYVQEIPLLFTSDSTHLDKVYGSSYSQFPISSLGIRNSSKIAVIHVTGTIAGGNDVDDPILGKIAGSRTIISNIKKAARSLSTKAIILRIDSPGGSALSSDLIWKAVKDAAEKKPVLASISDYGASGGYYIAMGADSIVNDPLSLIGSIGIFAGKFSTEGLYDKLGLVTERINRGKNASLFSTNSIWSDSERKVMQRLIDSYYKDFVTKVAESRNMSFEETDLVSQGRVWSGVQGVVNGLANSAGSFYSAIDIAKEMANISADESVRLSYYPKQKDLFTELYNLSNINFKNFFSVSEDLNITKFQNQPMALMPFIIKWK
jgi:protease-4